MKKLIYLLLVSFFINFVSAQKVENSQKLQFKNFYTNPVPSPNGNFVLLSSENFAGVYLLDLQNATSEPVALSNANGYGYSWANDNETIFYKVQPENKYVMDSELFSYNIRTKNAKKLDLNHNYLPSYSGANGVVVYTNINTLQIEAIDLSTKKSWVVTNGTGQFYSATLSHDGKKVAVHEGSEILVYNTDGSGLIANVGPGIATAWSFDDAYLIGYLSESSDGHVISGSELYAYDVKSKRQIKLTETPKVLESNVSFISENKIIYVDENDGSIIISELKF